MMKVIYFDGGCVPNPGMMEAAIVSDNEVICEHYPDLGYGTCNVAEWIGLIKAITAAVTLDEPVRIMGDSMLIINQANGVWRTKDANLQRYRAEYLFILATAKHPIEVRHIGRKLNMAGLYISAIQRDRKRATG